jgi:molybdopterin-dependent oxidoreductase alpha subunit
MALIKAIELLLYQAEKDSPQQVFDHQFIQQNTVGYNEFIESLEHYNVAELAQLAGVPLAQVQAAADMLKGTQKIIICWAMGVTQHVNGVATVKEIANLALLKGAIGKPGAGLCPVRGHSNVQGNRTMMIFDKPKKEQLDKLKEVFGFEPPRENGLDVVESIKAMHAGQLKVFFGMGGNFLSATPDTAYTAEGLRKMKLTVQVSTKLNRSHFVHGEEAIILPTYARSDRDITNGLEQIVSCENSMGVVQESKGVLDPVSDQLKSETVIVCEMAKAVMGNKSVIDWDKYASNYDHVRDDIERVIDGFENYNTRVREKGGFYLPNGPRAGKFATPDFKDKATFNVAGLPVNSITDDEYCMTTIRSHDQFNTTIYGNDDRYRGIHNERRVIFMNATDIARAGLKANDKVDLFSYFKGQERVARLFVVVPYNIPERDTATYYPEANVLVPIDSVAERSNTPTSKLVYIKIRKHEG